MAHVFISYARKDHEFVLNLKQHLENFGFEVWSGENIVAGQEWQVHIDNAIRDSMVCIVVLSEASAKSVYVTYEWAFARGAGVKVIPLLRETTSSALPGLASLQYLDFTLGNVGTWDLLINAISTIESDYQDRPRTELRTPRRVDRDLTPKQHIFLSYSRKNQNDMEKIKLTLETEHIRVWTDEKLELGTQIWMQKIEQSIENCICLVAILSPEAKASRWVREELNYAEAQGKPIITIMAHGDEKNAIPLGYTLSQRLDIREETKFHSEMKRLIETVHKHQRISQR